MHLIPIRSRAGDAGPLDAPAHSGLAGRFHFWRGRSGRRYACTVLNGEIPAGPAAMPAYERYVALFIRRRDGQRSVLAVTGAPLRAAVPADCDEIHIHLAAGDDALATAARDLAALAGPLAREIGTFSDLPVFTIGNGLEPRGSLQLRSVALFRRAASHSNVASRIPSVSSSFTVAST